MAHRNRSGRGSSRNNGGNSQHGEEAQIWEACKAQIAEIVTSINAENDNLAQIVSLDKKIGAMDPEKVATDLFRHLEDRSRAGVKFSETNMMMLKSVIEQLNVLRAVVLAKEQAEGTGHGAGPSGSGNTGGPSKRSTRDKGDGGAAAAAAAAALYDFEGAGDSPVPSPMAGGSAGRKHGDRASSTRDRDSMPPKADSVEPQGSIAGGSGGSGPGSAVSTSGAAGNGGNRRVVFSKGDTVAFKPKNSGGEATSDWILGEVAAVLGEGKSRRYKVLDVEPDEEPGKQKEYRTSASSMIAIAPESAAGTLKAWEAGKLVLALYPQTTTFYRAEVHSMDEGGRMVNLKFEGENDSTTLQQVERRFVIEYRQ
ncbi:hypothetical protein CDD81_7562 [Ophiocordyceps australis]|uniref:SGF29 C-terminal domain-containing protein n=1 Tax=Ophiocordyceps australis TaxID=1399860 RepID=A0A2C5Y5H2_9HYPO|nr:hypothetical protein CDD81_7562 [Ophiocordyceps australis]